MITTFQQMRTEALNQLAYHRQKKAVANRSLMSPSLMPKDRTAAEFDYAFHGGAAFALEGLLELPWEPTTPPEGLRS